MANVISDETMEYVGILAKLELKDEEKESARQDMQKMLDYVDKLNELDTSKAEPMPRWGRAFCFSELAMLLTITPTIRPVLLRASPVRGSAS